MCGYARRHISNSDLRSFTQTLNLPFINQPETDSPVLEHFYPAFGGAASRKLTSMYASNDGSICQINPTWWFECKVHQDTLLVDNSRTTFNARNLCSSYWKGAIRNNRGALIVTAIGEGKVINEKNTHFFVQGESPLILGTVFRRFPNDLYSAAIITRDAHPRFEQYHDKAFPFFLPPNPDFLKLWLSDSPETHPDIDWHLNNPQIHTNLHITPVKTFKDAKPLGPTEFLKAD